MTKTMSVPDFVRYGWHEEGVIQSFLAHLDRHKIKYRVIGTAIILFLGITDISFAASTGMDVGAAKIYAKLINVGKWVIIVKGGIDTIRSVAEGDVNTAKKNFLGYVVTYAILWALPWALGEVDKLFTNMDTAG
jgi:hypothetical protein